jgi:2-amino-4-hydroxy-6-hydroxymethyldihydropteridine diphosphokinase
MTTVFIALGSNLAGDQDSPVAQLKSALSALDQMAFSRIRRVSRCYRTPAWSNDPNEQQPDYVNAVCELATDLAADALLRACQAIEDRQLRVRDPARRFGPRTLDLDVLLIGQQQIRTLDLVVPHPRMFERAFVLVPLLEIAPDIVLPTRGKAAELLKQLDCSAIQAMDEVLWATSTPI